MVCLSLRECCLFDFNSDLRVRDPSNVTSTFLVHLECVLNQIWSFEPDV